jgi:hypothetical protein
LIRFELFIDFMDRFGFFIGRPSLELANHTRV